MSLVEDSLDEEGPPSWVVISATCWRTAVSFEPSFLGDFSSSTDLSSTSSSRDACGEGERTSLSVSLSLSPSSAGCRRLGNVFRNNFDGY